MSDDFKTTKKGMEAMRLVLSALQSYQLVAFGTEVLMQVETRRFDDGDFGILVTLNRNDDWEYCTLYSYSYVNNAKKRAKFLNDCREKLNAFGVKL